MDYFLRLNFNMNDLITNLTCFKRFDIYCQASFQKVISINTSTRKLYLRVLPFLYRIQQSTSVFYSFFFFLIWVNARRLKVNFYNLLF